MKDDWSKYCPIDKISLVQMDKLITMSLMTNQGHSRTMIFSHYELNFVHLSATKEGTKTPEKNQRETRERMKKKEERQGKEANFCAGIFCS